MTPVYLYLCIIHIHTPRINNNKHHTRQMYTRAAAALDDMGERMENAEGKVWQCSPRYLWPRTAEISCPKHS